MSYTIQIKGESNVDQQVKGIARRVINLTTDEMIRNLKINTPVDKGRARGSWFMSNYSENETKIKSSASHMKFLNDGTGIYGPKGQKIKPRTKKLLVFEYKGNTVFARSIKGIKPLRIVEKSIKDTKPRIPEFGKIATREAKR